MHYVAYFAKSETVLIHSTNSGRQRTVRPIIAARGGKLAPRYFRVFSVIPIGGSPNCEINACCRPGDSGPSEPYGIKPTVLLGVWGVGILDAGEIQQHFRDRHVIVRKYRGPNPEALGPAASAQGNDLTLGFIILSHEQRPADQPDFLIGKQADRWTLDRQPIVPRSILKQHAEHLDRNDRTPPRVAGSSSRR